MSEFAAAAIVLLLAGSLAGIALRRSVPPWPRVARWALPGGALVAAALVANALSHREPPPLPQPPDLPLQQPAVEDAGSGSCRACHPRQYDTWRSSYHSTMTQTVGEHSVLGDFDDAYVAYHGYQYRFYREGDAFYGQMKPPDDPALPPSPIAQITGSHHMQIYWTPVGDGRLLRSFPLVWWREQQRWIPRLSAFVTPPSNGPGPPSFWNHSCIGCHTTRPRPRLANEARDAVDSHVTEFGIACESCHGPGAEHAAARRSPATRYALHASGEPDPTIVDPSQLPHERSAQVCGQCHAVKAFHSPADSQAWGERGLLYHAGDDLEAHVGILSNATFDEPWARDIAAKFPEYIRGSFWKDGIVRVTGREYNALLDAPCFQRGEMSCLSCHTLHQERDDPRDRLAWADDQLDVGMDTNRACVQCHPEFEAPTALAEHSFHAPGSTGSECQNCHMPHTSYGLLKAVRAHEIGNPVALTRGPGSERPNACNLCHIDRPLAWTAEHLERWYGQPLPEFAPDDRRVAAAVRWALEGDAGVRALAAWTMGWEPAQQASGHEWVVPYLLQLMEDPYDAVRIIATRSLRTVPGFEDAAYDELAARPGRAAAARALRERWTLLPATPERRPAAALFGPDGRLDAAAFARRLSRRDDTPLNLAE